LSACAPTLHVPSSPLHYGVPIATTLEPGRYFLGMPSFLPGLPPAAAPAALHPIQSVVGEAAGCNELPVIDALLTGLSLSFEPRTLAQDREGPFFLRLRDDSLALRKEFAARHGAELMVSAECTENVELWLCEDCAPTTACAALCPAPGSPAPEATSGSRLPDAPVLKIAVPSGGVESVARISIDLFESQTE
jgi:hypothetical protein